MGGMGHEELEAKHEDSDTNSDIDAKMRGYSSSKDFVAVRCGQMIVEGVVTLAASVYHKRIIVRLSDFESNEYKSFV
eukprot:3859268-Alexandrium_andersonii.AAC.1